MSDIVEHNFAQFVRILGRGKHTSRSLTREEANAAFTLILKEEVLDIQLGAFLMLLRVKGENAHEMAGFADAAQQFINAPNLAVDIDWPSYACKNKQAPWYLLAALLLAEHGHCVFMHSMSHTTSGRVYAAQVLAQLGVPCCHSWLQIEESLNRQRFAFAELSTLCRPLDQLFSHRAELGVRSPVNSLIKLVNPLRATTSLQSVFHPAYLEIHQQAAQLLGHQHNLVLKGEGGEIEFRPDAENRLFLLNHGACSIEKWSRRQAERQPDSTFDAPTTAALLRSVWQAGCHTDKQSHDYALQAILGTTAMVLLASGSTTDEGASWQRAKAYWANRNTNRFTE